jgi:hypothetical protein
MAVAAVLVLAATGSSSAFAAEVCGSAKGRDTPEVGAADWRTALLTSFAIGYISEDHHFGTLAIMPRRPEPDPALITLADKDFDDEYRYCVVFWPYDGPVSNNFAQKSGCRDNCSVTLSTPSDVADPVFVLRGFSVSYSEADHHIKQLAIVERGSVLTVALNDGNDDDLFSFDVAYAYIPRAQFLVISDRKGTAHGGSRDKIEIGHALIRGFDLNFVSGDHHIKEMAIRLPGGGGLDTSFADNNGDDPFSYTVEYGVIPFKTDP